MNIAVEGVCTAIFLQDEGLFLHKNTWMELYQACKGTGELMYAEGLSLYEECVQQYAIIMKRYCCRIDAEVNSSKDE